MFHTQANWLRTLLLHPRKPFGFRCCVGQGVLTPLPSRRPGEARKAVYQGREGIQELLTWALRAGGSIQDHHYHHEDPMLEAYRLSSTASSIRLIQRRYGVLYLVNPARSLICNMVFGV